MSDIMEKLDNIINNNVKVNYSIFEVDYKKYILDKDIMNAVIKKISNYIDDICFFIPNEDERYISDFKLIYNEFDLMEVTQGEYIYKKISIII